MIRGGPGPDRAATPAVGKALEAAIVVAFLGIVTTTLFGGLVPDYRGTAGDELGDRALSVAAHHLEDAVGPDATVTAARVRVRLPETIAGEGYRIHADGRTLVLSHPDPRIGGRTRLALPEHVVAVRGSWHSRLATTVRVEPADGDVVVRLVSGSGDGDGPPGGGGRR